MNNGGYKIIDFNSVDRKNGVSMVLEGIYNDIESTRKAILVSGLVIDGHDYHDEIAKLKIEGSFFYLIGNEFVIEVQSNNVITPIDNSARITEIISDDDTSFFEDGGVFDIMRRIIICNIPVKWRMKLISSSDDALTLLENSYVVNLLFTYDISETYFTSSFTFKSGLTLKNVGIYFGTDDNSMSIVTTK